MYRVKKDECLLLILDIQERLFPQMIHGKAMLESVLFTLRYAQKMAFPIFFTEQKPEKLGETLPLLKENLPFFPLIKSSFSAYRDPKIREAIEETGKKKILLVGLEANICILQTAQDLLLHKMEVIIVQDGISARNQAALASGIEELRNFGARISLSETLLYELLEDANHPLFKELLPLIKSHSCA